jgi:hypothetical protein
MQSALFHLFIQPTIDALRFCQNSLCIGQRGAYMDFMRHEIANMGMGDLEKIEIVDMVIVPNFSMLLQLKSYFLKCKAS